MNYRHQYHAGNFADVVKHVALIALLRAFTHKEKPFFYLDTHAGAGWYRLDSPEALRTNEAKNGIAKIVTADNPPELVQDYLKLIREFNSEQEKMLIYPGSPALAQKIMRPQDRLFFCELQLREYNTLLKAFPKDHRITIQARDGFGALKAFLPPSIKRGLILIDPPFEKPGEFKDIVEGVTAGLERFATGTYAIWYPLKQIGEVNAFYRNLVKLRKPLLKIDFRIAPLSENFFAGCGLAIINPPFTFDTAFQKTIPWLIKHLSNSPDARATLEWLVQS